MPGSRVRLSEKTTVEARRVLLSDIGFTSMVPELSRSADHLFPANLKPPIVTTYGQFLRTTDLYSPGCQVSLQKFYSICVRFGCFSHKNSHGQQQRPPPAMAAKRIHVTAVCTRCRHHWRRHVVVRRQFHHPDVRF